MAFTTAEMGIELLMDVTNGLAEIRDRLTARAFGAVHNPEQGPEVRIPVARSIRSIGQPSGLRRQRRGGVAA